MFYAINICVPTKNTKRYDRVALNEFPIIFDVDSEEEIVELLTSETIRVYCQNLITSEKLYREAKLCIKCIADDGPKEMVWNLDEYVIIKTF